MSRWIKRTLVLTTVGVAVGLALFGGDLYSYVRSSAHSMRNAVSSSVPVEFELQRAKDMLDDILPEMHANIRRMAEEEVEIAALRDDIAAGEKRIDQERTSLARLTDMLAIEQASYTFGDRQYPRQEVKAELSRRFEHFKEAEMVLEGKERLLRQREASLAAAEEALRRARQQKALLADRIAALEAQHSMIESASTGSNLRVDDSKLAKAEKLINEIRTRLDVSERVLAHEARFTETIPVDDMDEADLVAQVREHLDGETKERGEAVAIVKPAR